MPTPHPSSASLDRARLSVVLTTILVNVAGVVLFSFFSWSDWRTGLALNAVDNTILGAFVLRCRDRLLAHLMAFGLAVGVVELAADAWLVEVTRTLDYSIGGGPMLWRSPAWMPLAWEIVSVQFGYLGLCLTERWGAAGLLATGLLGAVNIPFYEEMALRTRWWKYSGCKMVLHTPYYIILGEFLIAMALAALARRVRSQRPGTTLAAGALAGVSILPGYAVPFWLIDRS